MDVFEVKDLSPSNTKRTDLISAFIPLIKYLARKLLAKIPSHIEQGDLVNAGVLGLIDAINKYDRSRDNLFKTYAEFRINGAMLDEARSYDWLSKAVRKKTRKLGVQDAYLQRQILEVYEDWKSSKPQTPYQELNQLMEYRQLENAIQTLPERQRKAITLYYFKELNMKEIGKSLGVTESAISLLLTQARNTLRTLFQEKNI